MKISIELDAAPRDGESRADLEARVHNFLVCSHVVWEAFEGEGIDVRSIQVVDRPEDSRMIPDLRDLLDRVHLLEEEHEWPGGGQSWIQVGDVTVRSMGWGTPEEREALGVVDLFEALVHLRVGESHAADRGLGGRTRFTRRT